MSNFSLLFGLHLSERILRITDNLSKTLQLKYLCAAEAQVIVSHTVKTLMSMRHDEEFLLFWKHMDILRVRMNTNEPVLPRKRKTPRRFEVGEGDSSHSSTVEDHYRKLYFEALDLAINCIQDRFNQPGYKLYQTLEELLVKAANKEDYSEQLHKVVAFYGSDFDKSELHTQLQIFGSCFSTSSGTEKITLKEALRFLQSLSDAQRSFYKQVCWVARLIIVLPATNAASERSFSTMKRIKTYLRSTMKQDRLNHLMILNIYKELTKKLDLVKVANEFISGSEHRKNFFGSF